MSVAEYKYQAKDVDEIVSRDFNFDFPLDLDPVWVPDNPVRSHLFNGFSLSMPYLEPFLIRSALKAREQIEDPCLVDDIQQFNRQEANHFKCHRRYNQILKDNGYPELARVEAHMTKAYARLEEKNLETQLAYGAGFESMTNGFTNWFVGKRKALFEGANPHVSSFWIMHMIEEGEHKTVAFDVYMATSGRYLPRMLGVLHGSGHILMLGLWAMFVALKKDNLLFRPRTWLGIAREMSSILFNIGPYLLRAMKPSFNPRQESEPQWMKDWVAGYATLPAGANIPLVDTSDPEMPVPF